MARRKLGPPIPATEEGRIDVWDYPGHSLVIEYRRDLSSISLLHLSNPDGT